MNEKQTASIAGLLVIAVCCNTLKLVGFRDGTIAAVKDNLAHSLGLTQLLDLLCCLQIALSSAGAASFRTPKGLCVPFGNLERALEAADQASGKGMGDRALELLLEMEEAPMEQLDELCRQMQVRKGLAGRGRDMRRGENTGWARGRGKGESRGRRVGQGLLINGVRSSWL